MNVLFVSAEVAPFVSVGGLSQVMYFLPRALLKQGIDARVFTAKYGTMDLKTPSKPSWRLQTEMEQLFVPIKHTYKPVTSNDPQPGIYCNVLVHRGKTDPTVYFLENREYYELRANVFGYMDDHVRFALLSKGCLEWLRQQKRKKGKDAWMPDIIHCNDWHTAYLLSMARNDLNYKDLFEKTALVFTVHNFQFQGNQGFRYLPVEKQDKGLTPLAPLTDGELINQNALLRGLIYADQINTVSPTHAVEVLTPEYAEGLEDSLLKVRSKLTGILNGLDTTEFNPATDVIVKKQYNARSFVKAREINKQDLQYEFGLPQKPDAPLLAISGRLSQQKGWNLLLEVLPHLLAERADIQFIALGSGEDQYRDGLLHLKSIYPTQIGLHLHADFRLPRKIFSGADIQLMPSMFEPGGIVALEALRYGAVPLVRRTGGLNDIIQDFDPATGKGNGFSFVHKDAWSLYGTIIEALTIYKSPDLWRQVVKNALECDFSWDTVAKEYGDWYSRVIHEKKRATGHTPHPAYKPIQTESDADGESASLTT